MLSMLLAVVGAALLQVGLYWAASVPPTLQDDVMGQYQVTSHLQCHRLCWYRKLCASHSFLHLGPAATNCVLHAQAAAGPGVTSPMGWKRRPASLVDVGEACSQRPCGPAHVCVPAPPSSHACLPVPALCPTTPTVPFATVSGTPQPRQEDLADVTCAPGFVMAPEEADGFLRCLVTSKWSSFDGTCHKIEYVFPDSKLFFTKRFPWILRENSSFCFKGNFYGTQDTTMIYINFRSADNTPYVVNTRLTFGYSFVTDTISLSWTVKESSGHQAKRPLGEVAALPGDGLVVSGHVLADRLRVVLNGRAMDVPFSRQDQPALDGVTVSFANIAKVEIGNDPNVGTYINLVRGC